MHCYSNVSKSIKIKLILKNIRNKKCIIYCILDYKKRFDKGIILLIPKMFFFLFFACSVSALFQLLHIKYTASHCQNIMKKKPRFLFVFFSILPFLRILRNYWNISISLYNENWYEYIVGSKNHFICKNSFENITCFHIYIICLSDDLIWLPSFINTRNSYSIKSTEMIMVITLEIKLKCSNTITKLLKLSNQNILCICLKNIFFKNV